MTVRAAQKMGSAVHFYVIAHVVEPRCGREGFAQWLLPPATAAASFSLKKPPVGFGSNATLQDSKLAGGSSGVKV